MNFPTFFEKGQQGKNLGLPTGIPSLDRYMMGLRKAQIIGIAAPPKAGKTTFADFAFVLMPYLLSPPGTAIHWEYLSYEIDRVTKEAKFIAFFMYHDYKIAKFEHEGKWYQMSGSYISGLLKDDNENLIKVSEAHLLLVKQIYRRRIIPLFGQYDSVGKKIKNGKINFIEERDNPTGIRKHLIKLAEEKGKFVFQTYTTITNGVTETKKRRVGYVPNNPDEYVIIVTDHLRKINPERGYTTKQTVDKMVEYQVELRNMCKFIFIDVIHLNRNFSSIDRLKFSPETLYPTGDDVKDTGNLSEDCNVMITMFNPNDEKYNIKKHFGMLLQDKQGNQLVKNYRSLHIVEGRDIPDAPIHLQIEMNGGINYFRSIRK